VSENFKRLHLFNGMLATEEDWNAGVNYHYAKGQLHNRVMHGAGVVPHFREGLTVRALQPPGMKVVVNPGMAIDPLGNELFLWDPVLLSINPEEFGTSGKPFSGNLFVCVSFEERPDDFAVSETDSRITGHRRIEEGARVRVSAEGVRPEDVELARIYIVPEVQQIADAVNVEAPRPGEIDLRFVPHVGQPGGRISSVSQQLLISALDRRHKLLGNWVLEYEVMDANLPRPTLLTAKALVKGGLLDRAGLVSLLLGVTNTEDEMCTLIKQKKGDWERVWVSKEFKAYKEAWQRAQKALATLEAGPTPAMDSAQFFREVDRALERFREVNVPLERLTEQLPNLLERGAASGPTYEEVSDSALKAMGTEPPRRLAIDGKPFVLVDSLEVTSPASEEAHFFRLEVGPNDVVQGTTPATYPDGNRVTDSGLSYRRGSVYFQVNDVKPGRDMLILRRVEFRELNVEEEVRVDDQPIGVWRIEGDDRENQWRNVMFMVDGEFLVGPRPRFRLRLMEGSSPSNMYRYWFYQAA
jgi:hypothetical protein